MESPNFPIFMEPYTRSASLDNFSSDSDEESFYSFPFQLLWSWIFINRNERFSVFSIHRRYYR